MQHDLTERVVNAVKDFVRGDPAPFAALWAEDDEVSIFGAFGGHQAGGSQIRARLEWAASQYREGQYEYQPIAEVHGHDLAYTVGLERTTLRSQSGDKLVRERRVTFVYRLLDDDWRIVHHHADPLVETSAPK